MTNGTILEHYEEKFNGLGELIAYCGTIIQGDYSSLTAPILTSKGDPNNFDIWVREDIRGMGLGKELLTGSILMAKTQGASVLEIGAVQPESVNFYKRVLDDLVKRNVIRDYVTEGNLEEPNIHVILKELL